MMRVMILGLDGGTFDVIDPLMAQGRLPNLAAIKRQGCWGHLVSTVPPITPVAWTSFMTGKGPGKHGIFDFDQIQADYSMVPPSANQHNHKTIWRIASECGKRVVALDIPFTYPPEEVNGVLTCGFGTPKGADASFCHPSHLADDMRSRFGSFPVAVPDTATRKDRRLFGAWDRIMENRARVVPYVHSNYEWDLFAVVFGVTDNILHALWTYLDPIHPDFHASDASEMRNKVSSYYAQVDQIIGELLAQTDSATRIFVVSDHGFGTTSTRDYLPQLLIDKQLLHYRGVGVLSHLRASAMKHFLRAYEALSPLKFFLRGISKPRRMRIKARAMRAIDWARTRVFTGSQRLQLHLYVNRAGKFEQGIAMTDAEYAELLSELKGWLLELRHPHLGKPILSTCHETDAKYKGEHGSIAPDLVLEYANFYNPDRTGSGTKSAQLEGNHVPEGILLAKGGGIACGYVGTFELVDVAPTVLYSLGLPIPSDMDGHAMTSLFEPSALAKEDPIISSQPAIVTDGGPRRFLTQKEEEQLRARLRDLDYL